MHPRTGSKAAFCFLLLVLLVLPLPAQSDDEQRGITRYYLWHYHELEGASMIVKLGEQLFSMPARAYYRMGTLDASALSDAEGEDPLALTLAIEPYGTRIGVENLRLGPVSLAATGMMSVPGYQPLFANAFPSQIEAEYPGQTFGGQLYPASGYSLSVSVPPYASILFARENRRFLYHRYDAATGDSVLFTTEDFVGYQVKLVVHPSQVTPGVPLLNRVDLLEFETVTEGLEPDGFTVTNLITLPELLRSQIIATAGRSNTTDLWFLKSSIYAGAGLIGVETDLYSRAPLLRRYRISTDFILAQGLLWRLVEGRELDDVFAVYDTFGGALIARFDLYYERDTFPLVHVGLPGFVTQDFAGFVARVISRSPVFDALMELQWGLDLGTVFNDGADYYLPPNPRIITQDLFGLRLNFMFRYKLN